MQITTLLLVLSTAFLLVSPIAYAVSIIRGGSRPHRLTRLALMAAMLLTFASAIAANANPGALLLTGIMAVQSVIIFALSLWRGMGGGKNAFDWSCFVLAVVGLAGWQISGNALVGMWFAIFADTMAYIPAYIKTWEHPHTEGPMVLYVGYYRRVFKSRCISAGRHLSFSGLCNCYLFNNDILHLPQANLSFAHPER